MKGAIGSAVILNIVITFITIFLLLLVGAMSYTKSIKIKNYILVEVEKTYEKTGKIPSNTGPSKELDAWNAKINPYLAKAGYHISNKNNTCPNRSQYGYTIKMNTKTGNYDYCIYERVEKVDNMDEKTKEKKGNIESYTTYMVLAYMRLDLPVVGDYFKIPTTGETPSYIKLK